MARDYGTPDNVYVDQMWQSSVYGCFEDYSVCMMVYCFPCYMFGINAKSVGSNGCAFGIACCLCPITSICLRSHIRGKIRKKQKLLRTDFIDCCAVFWCFCCTLYQESVEVKHYTLHEPKVHDDEYY